MDGESNDEWDIHHSLGFHGKCLKTSTRQITLSSPTLLHVLNANGGFSDGAFLLYSETRLLMSRCTRLQSLRFPLLHETSSDFTASDSMDRVGRLFLFVAVPHFLPP